MIEEVRKYPNLYNSSLVEYRDHERSEQSWISIGRLFPDRTWRETKDRWKYLRDQFTKLKRSGEGRSGDAGGKKPKWKYYDLMSFLTDHVKHRETDGNTSRYVFFSTTSNYFSCGRRMIAIENKSVRLPSPFGKKYFHCALDFADVFRAGINF